MTETMPGSQTGLAEAPLSTARIAPDASAFGAQPGTFFRRGAGLPTAHRSNASHGLAVRRPRAIS